MYFPKYWARETNQGAFCWGWSDLSLDEAKVKAYESARALSARLAQGKVAPNRAKDYAYGNRPLREPVLEEFPDPNGKGAALISRNGEGCFVLNTAQIMFLDIDSDPTAGIGLGGFISKLFGGKPKTPHQEALDRIHAWSVKNPSWGLRVYGTAGGLRILVTHDFFDPSNVDKYRVFDELGVDPLYRKLCLNQKSFRARLSPKPYRCEIHSAPFRWPFTSYEIEQKFKEWEKGYAKASESMATCMFLSHLGTKQSLPEIERIIQIHDQRTKAMTKLTLA